MLTSKDDVEATMVHKPILAPEVTIKVPHADLKLWKATKSKMPKMCDSKYVEVALPQKHHMILMEFQKVKVAMALHKAMEANQVTADQVAFTMNPALLYSKVKFAKKQQLKLVPLGNIVHIKPEKVTNSMIVVKGFGQQWQVQPWKADSNFDNAECPLVTFWWCKKVREDQEANMVISHLTIDNVTIPYLTNEAAIGKDQPLLYSMGASGEGNASEAKGASAKKRKTT